MNEKKKKRMRKCPLANKAGRYVLCLKPRGGGKSFMMTKGGGLIPV